jgi:hypothetical protein
MTDPDRAETEPDPLNFWNPNTMVLTESSSAGFEPAPAGTHPARLVRLIDLGTQLSTFDGEEKKQRKLLLVFEICDGELRTDDGKPFLVSKRFGASLHPRASLRQALAAWGGRDLTPEELKGFDLAKLLGKPVLLGVTHAERDGRTFANISGLSRMPKGMQVEAATERLVHFSLDAPDWETYESLGERLRQQIASSPEFAAARQKPSTPFADMNDDVPY